MKNFDGPLMSVGELIEGLPCGIALVNGDGNIDLINHRLTTLTGYSVDSLVGHDIHTLLNSPGCYSQFLSQMDEGNNKAEKAESHSERHSLRCRDGHEISVDIVLSHLDRKDGPWTIVEVRGISDDVPQDVDPSDSLSPKAISDAKIAASLAESEQRFRMAFEGSMAPMVFSDRDGKFLAVNGAFCAMSGRIKEELLGHDSKHFTHPDDIGVAEEAYHLITSGVIDEYRYGKRFLHKNGRVVFAEVSICAARDELGESSYFVSSVRDVTEERELSAQLSFQALHDPLTGLANRALFDDHLFQARSRATREGKFGAVLLMDLDDFKGVNDSFGHLVGDQLLIEVANRFKGVTRTSDTLCRFGGDEFLYLAEGLSSREEAEIIGQRLLDTLSEPLIFGDICLEQQVSIGIVVWNGDGADNVELVQKADAAMYEAKRQGHGHIAMFTPKIGEEAVSRFAIVQELRHALGCGDVAMHYQPIYDLASASIVGFEALMRWHHPDRGWIPPDVFIPLAEQSDLILDLGVFALRTAIEAASTWDVTDEAKGLPYVTVNLSARQFHDPGLVPLLQIELNRCGVDATRLILEVTESVALVDVTETMNVMDELNHLGIGIALDDFGTGYSSLSYLAALNPRIIKIDQSFVRPKHDKRRSDTLLEAIVTLGNKLNMTVLAEGIETSAQLDRLNHLDCELGQGFLWSPAVPGEDVGAMLAANNPTTPLDH